MRDFIFLIVIFIGAVSFAIWGFVLNNELKEKNNELFEYKKNIENLVLQIKIDSSILSNYQEATMLFLKNYPSEYLHFESIMEKLEIE